LNSPKTTETGAMADVAGAWCYGRTVM